MQRSRRRRRLLRVLLVLVLLAVGWFWIGQPAVRKHQLAAACVSADRIVLVFRTPPERTPSGDWTRGERVSHEIVGREKVDTLLKTIQLRASIPGLACRCSTVPVIELSDRSRVLASLTIHHDTNLRWLNGPWRGDARLTITSAQALPAWIDDEGGPALAQLRRRLHGLWDTFRASREMELKELEAIGTRPAEVSLDREQ